MSVDSQAPPRLRLAILASHFTDYSLELALELAAEHDVLLSADKRRLALECDAAQVAQAQDALSLLPLDQSNAAARALSTVQTAARWLPWRPHAVIAHEHGLAHLTALQRLGAGIGRTLLIVHDPQPHAGRDAVLAARRAQALRAQRRNAAVLVTHGQVCARSLAAASPDAEVIAIPHGPVLRPPGGRRPPAGEGRLLMFGRMEAYKGLDVLLEACRRLDARGACPPLEILGEGPELDRLAPAFAGLAQVTTRRGYASREALIAAMSTADGVVLPYTEATQSGVAAAAFANGRAVLASAVGGLPEVVQEGVNGRLVPPRDPAALAEAMLRFSREAASFSAAALRAAEETLAWRHAARALAAAASGLPAPAATE